MAQIFGGMPQSEFVARADNVTQLHIQHVNKATADLNLIMSSLGAKTQVSVDNVLSIAPQGEPASVNFVPNEDVATDLNLGPDMSKKGATK